MHQIEILAALIKALLPFATGTNDQANALDEFEMGDLTGYDIFENACAHHYRLTHNEPYPINYPIEEYAKTV